MSRPPQQPPVHVGALGRILAEAQSQCSDQGNLEKGSAAARLPSHFEPTCSGDPLADACVGIGGKCRSEPLARPAYPLPDLPRPADRGLRTPANAGGPVRPIGSLIGTAANPRSTECRPIRRVRVQRRRRGPELFACPRVCNGLPRGCGRPSGGRPPAGLPFS